MAVGTNQMRKFLNDPAAVVKEALAGPGAAHSQLLASHVANQIIVSEDAVDEGINVPAGGSDDDVAVQDSLYTAGRRGVGATVLAEKIAGAAAEGGADLAKVTDLVKKVNARSRSFGVALSSCVPPAAGKVIFDLPEGQIELGFGLHGEPGRRRAPLGAPR